MVRLPYSGWTSLLFEPKRNVKRFLKNSTPPNCYIFLLLLLENMIFTYLTRVGVHFSSLEYFFDAIGNRYFNPSKPSKVSTPLINNKKLRLT